MGKSAIKEICYLLIFACLLLPVTIFSMGCVEDNNNQCKSIKLVLTDSRWSDPLEEPDYGKVYIDVINMEDHPLYDVKVELTTFKVDSKSINLSSHPSKTLGDIGAGKTKSDEWLFQYQDPSFAMVGVYKMTFLITWDWKGQQNCNKELKLN